ncbi:sentrin-specific protease 1-like [Olea europaea subsp. europaea]|uniref:Sentrin-specific protease 1-like n=1 Tax=Olea europaea subsp. europaea TaxID=158383 RepID=A0A8S0R288_OLEEU|nr:sentrin-specific protease 1-like [Olea europaea subsp. europaea]
MDPCDDLLFSLEPPLFDLWIAFTSSNVLHSEETQKRVDSIISDVLMATKTVANEGPPTVEPTSKLPVKRVLRSSRVLQSPFVAGQERGKLFKHDDNVVVFEDYKDNVDEVDKSTFMGWFQRGVGHMKKFSKEDNAIKPIFLIGSFPVGQKTWFHELINSESSLSGEADVDYMFMPIIPTNKAHWMFGLLQFRSHTLTVFNSVDKSYRDWKVLQGIEPYVKVLPTLMNALGISKKDLDYHEPETKELKVIIDDTLPQQTNGHDCEIFVVLYALYLICGGRCSILKKFDASKFRMDIATLLYEHRQV